jgi:hypothetical protein
MKSLSQLVGYDVRRGVSPFLLGLWDDDRRDEFLLRPDVRYPFSVDRFVWPSRFQLGPDNPYPFPQQADTIVIDLATANQHFQLFDLWDDLVKMLGPYRSSPEGDYGIAAGLVCPEHYPSGSGFVRDDWWRAIHGSPISPAKPQDGWKLIGHDVANSGYTSSVSNFGTLAGERGAMRKNWGGSINEYGLFETIGDAMRFCADSNVRLASDGPFFVFELFVIWGSVPSA